MAVGLGPLPTLHPVAGFELGIASAGIKRPGRKDVVVMRCAEGSTVAGVFTLNAFCAAPVILAKQRVAGNIRYLLTNTGNANAGTGEPGLVAAARTCAKLAQLTGVDASQVLPYSTGVIGEPLPVEKIEGALQAALDDLSVDNWAAAATGIMTTDTLPKGASRQFVHEGVTVTVTGISKGAGMIRPNMATMLGYIATDAKVSRDVLHSLILDGANKSFNRITIDGDTSTNDCCMLIATGQANLPEITSASGPLFAALKQAVFEVCMDVAQAIVRDGEGATKFVTVEVNGGGNHQECLDVGYTVAHSPLIKTALFASDPNWGRILAAVGRAGVPDLDVSKIDVFLGDVCIASRGARAETYTEAQGLAVMQQEEITIRIELGRGECNTVILSLGGMFFGLLLGFGLALMRLSRFKLVSWLARVYVSFFRGTPLLVQLFLIYYGLPQVGIELEPIPAAMIGFSLNMAAYACEILRAAIGSIERGQWEAAASIGMTRAQTLRRAILPQAMRTALPPLGNSFISLVKDTALAATIQVPELFRQAQLVSARTFEIFTMYLSAALIYWILASLLAHLQNRLEDRVNRHDLES